MQIKALMCNCNAFYFSYNKTWDPAFMGDHPIRLQLYNYYPETVFIFQLTEPTGTNKDTMSGEDKRTVHIQFCVAVLTCKVLIGPHDLFRGSRNTLSASRHPGFTFIKTTVVKKDAGWDGDAPNDWYGFFLRITGNTEIALSSVDAKVTILHCVCVCVRTFYSQQLIPQPPSSRLPCRAMLRNSNKLTPRLVTQALTPFIRGFQTQVQMTGLAIPTEVCDPSTLKVLPVFYKEQQRPQPRGDQRPYQPTETIPIRPRPNLTGLMFPTVVFCLV